MSVDNETCMVLSPWFWDPSFQGPGFYSTCFWDAGFKEPGLWEPFLGPGFLLQTILGSRKFEFDI